MGIGISLATGLIQGFTRNIEQEKARRIAERDKLESYRTILATAMMDKDDYNAEAGTMLGNMIDSAQGKMDSQERVGIFGKQGEDINVDFTSIVPLLTTAPDDDDGLKPKFVIGSGDEAYNFQLNLADQTTPSGHINALGALQRVIQQNPDKFRNVSKGVYSDFVNLAKTNTQALAAYTVMNRNPENDLPDFGEKGNKLIQTINYLEDMFFTYDNDYKKGILPAFLTAETAKLDPTVGSAGVGTNESTDESDNDSDVPRVIVLDKPNEEDKNSVNFLQNNFGVRDFKQMATVWNEYAGVPGFTTDQKSMLWKATVNFGTQYNITTPFDRVEDIDPSVAKDMFKSLSNVTGGNLTQMAFILGAYQKPMPTVIEGTPRAGTIPGTGGKDEEPVYTAKLHAARVMLYSTATEKDFQKIMDTNNALNEVLNDETGLRALRNMTFDFSTAPKVSEIAKKFSVAQNVLGFFFNFDEARENNSAVITSSSITSVANETIYMSRDRAIRDGVNLETGFGQEDPETGLPKEYITENFVNGLNADIREAEERGKKAYADGTRMLGADGKKLSMEEMGKMYARFESMRISLAFQMARAADPSGRLSNQDIENQLIRLGGDLDTPEQMRERIDKAIRDFEIKQERYKHLAKYENATGPATDSQKMQIQGHHDVTRLARQAGFKTATGGVVSIIGDETQSAPPEGDATPKITQGKKGNLFLNGKRYTPVGDGVWYDENANPVTDQTILDALNSFMPASSPAPENQQDGMAT